MRARWASAVREGPSPSSPHGARWRLSTGRWAGMARPGSVGAVLRALLRAGSGRIEACACARVGGESMCSRESAHILTSCIAVGTTVWVVRVFARVGHFYRFTSLVLEGRQLYPFHRFRFSGRSHTFTPLCGVVPSAVSHTQSLSACGAAHWPAATRRPRRALLHTRHRLVHTRSQAPSSTPAHPTATPALHSLSTFVLALHLSLSLALPLGVPAIV